MALPDLSGQRIGRVLVLALLPQVKISTARKYLCRCDCGAQVELTSQWLKRGDNATCHRCAGEASRPFSTLDNAAARRFLTGRGYG